jgi:hypothetical protein
MKALFVEACLCMLVLAARLPARTITLTDLDCDKMAAIAADAPRLSWAGYQSLTGLYETTLIDLTPSKAFLIRFPLGKVPKGQRITRAELTFSVNLATSGDQKVHVRRILGDWGAGVCYQYRMTRPNKVEWKEAGARASAADRAPKASAVARVNGAGDVTVNLTEDVELWYTGAGANQGWIVTVEDADVLVRLLSPLGSGKGQWKLQITFEPE